MKKSVKSRKIIREKKKIRIRKKISGVPEMPRLCVFRSSKHMYAQIIDDTIGKTVVSASTIDKNFEAEQGDNKKAMAVKVGKVIAKLAIEKGISKVVFDRNGFLYHGRVKALSDGAREAGLVF